MKKILKIVMWTLVWTVLALVTLVLTHPLWLGSAVKCAAEKIGPKYTGTPLAIGSLDINLYKGCVRLSEFCLDNPKGASEKTAVSLGLMNVEIDLSTVSSNVVVVKDVSLQNLFASYVSVEGAEKMNFDVIAENAAAQMPAEEGETVVAEPEEPAEPAEEQKVIIEHLKIEGVKALMYGFPIVVPVSIEMEDIGKESQGIGYKEAWLEIQARIVKALGGVGDGLLNIGGKGLDTGKQCLDFGIGGVTNAVDAGLNLDFNGAGDILKSTGEGLKGAGKELKDLGKDFRNIFKKKNN